ncbi:unnamed protein product [Clavelina lepadiformis]|uniref:Uncharacterized protein n=1 Tax=Clavelina lepadiformis TaxID=159417 RepID=A0ABP0FH94_CLALP
MFNHPYPCRKTMWIPDPKSDYRYLSTSGDDLRLWRVSSCKREGHVCVCLSGWMDGINEDHCYVYVKEQHKPTSHCFNGTTSWLWTFNRTGARLVFVGRCSRCVVAVVGGEGEALLLTSFMIILTNMIMYSGPD